MNGSSPTLGSRDSTLPLATDPPEQPHAASVAVILRCEPALLDKVRYVFDTLLMAAGVEAVYQAHPPADGPWILYAPADDPAWRAAHRVAVAHNADAWRFFTGTEDAVASHTVDGLAVVLPQQVQQLHGFDRPVVDIGFDLVANAFYFLSSWSERLPARAAGNRQLHGNSAFARLGVPQDIVDRYLARLVAALDAATPSGQHRADRRPAWPGGAEFAVVLSHDVDFIPVRPRDNLVQGAKSVLRHLLKEKDPVDAWRSARGLVRAWLSGRDPYGCVPELIAAEQARGVRSSFQVAVGHRHANDVNYHIENDATRDYLRAIEAAGFDLCLHGSYRSTENIQWYADEAALLGSRLARPLGSRQHFLSFDYDQLFTAQELAGVRYDMSMGFPDRTGPRAGFSFPYFPYCLQQDRPYNVLQISLFLMDVTLRSYLRLKLPEATTLIAQTVQALRRKGGCASVVWHPIVFGGARDPGYDALYWELVREVQAQNGLATDGRSVNDTWRERAACYGSFAGLQGS